jgi:DNA repair photolyase
MPVESISGRGATRNATPMRFNLKERIADGDWLDEVKNLDGTPPRRTTVTVERPKSIITRNNSPDLGFDRSINPYRGCEHGCIYCFARPTHAFHDLSPGSISKAGCLPSRMPPSCSMPRCRSRLYVAPIALGTNTDPYQPIEEHWRITARSSSTAGNQASLHHHDQIGRVVRDLDISGPRRAGHRGGCDLGDVARPRRCTARWNRGPCPRKRLAAIKALSEAGVPAFASIAPVIPQITDHETGSDRAEAAEAGPAAQPSSGPATPRSRALFRAWLDEHYPDRAAKVMATIQSLRGGKDNDPNFFSRMRGSGPWAELIRTRFDIACRKHNLPRLKIPLRRDLFEAAPRRPIATF